MKNIESDAMQILAEICMDENKGDVIKSFKDIKTILTIITYQFLQFLTRHSPLDMGCHISVRGCHISRPTARDCSVSRLKTRNRPTSGATSWLDPGRRERTLWSRQTSNYQINNTALPHHVRSTEIRQARVALRLSANNLKLK